MQNLNNSSKTKQTINGKQNCDCNLFKDGKSLNVMAATIANVVSEKFNNDELAVLAIFLTTIGDCLATIVAANALLNNGNNGVKDVVIREPLI